MSIAHVSPSRWIIFRFLLFALTLSADGVAAQTTVTGDCNVTNATVSAFGRITVNCPGLRPQVLKALEDRLLKLNVSNDGLQRKATELSKKYRRLEEKLRKLPSNNANASKAWQQLDQFNLSAVEKLLSKEGLAAMSENAMQDILGRAIRNRSKGDVGQRQALENLVKLGRSMDGRDFAGLHLAHAQLSGARFERANLKATNFSGVMARGAKFKGASFSWANFENSVFDQANLELTFHAFALGRGSSFVGAQAKNSQWVGADLRGADFSNADLRLANFQFSDLRGAKFRGAKLNLAYFVGSRLDGADFTDAAFETTDVSYSSMAKSQLSSSQISEACTTLPPDRSFSFKLMSTTPTTKYKSGLSFNDEYHQYYVSFPGVHRGLRACPLRKTIPAARLPIAFVVPPQKLSDHLGMRIQSTVLAGGRRTEFRNRATAHIKTIRRMIAARQFLRINKVAPVRLPTVTTRAGPLLEARLTRSGAQIMYAVLKTDGMDKYFDKAAIQNLAGQLAVKDAERWKSSKGRRNSWQESALRDGIKAKHLLVPISWQRISKERPTARRGFIEALMIDSMPLKDLGMPDECVSNPATKCLSQLYVFDPMELEDGDPAFEGERNASVLRSLLDEIRKLMPRQLSLVALVRVDKFDPNGRIFPRYHTEVSKPHKYTQVLELGSKVLRVYGTNSFSFDLSNNFESVRRWHPSKRIAELVDIAHAGEIARTIGAAKKLRCYGTVGVDRIVDISKIKLSRKELEKLAASDRKNIRVRLALSNVKIVADRVYGKNFNGEDCLLSGELTGVFLAGKQGEIIARIPLSVFEKASTLVRKPSHTKTDKRKSFAPLAADHGADFCDLTPREKLIRLLANKKGGGGGGSVTVPSDYPKC
ncbi:MAG: pentapeptide repeat-containing protein [Pseudomonadota bacterium]